MAEAISVASTQHLCWKRTTFCRVTSHITANVRTAYSHRHAAIATNRHCPYGAIRNNRL
jgi:hypothetical protein